MADGQTIEARLGRVELEQVSLREEMQAGFARTATRDDLRALGDDLRAEMRSQGEDLRAQMQTFHDESIATSVELREYVEFVSARHATETRHYFDVAGDGLRDDIRRIADAQAATGDTVAANSQRLDATNDRIDRLEARVDSGFADVGREFAGVKTDIADLKTDMAGVKTDIAGVKTDMAGVKTDMADVKRDIADLKRDIATVVKASERGARRRRG